MSLLHTGSHSKVQDAAGERAEYVLLEELVQPKLAGSLNGVAKRRWRPAPDKPAQAAFSHGDPEALANSLILLGINLQPSTNMVGGRWVHESTGYRISPQLWGPMCYDAEYGAYNSSFRETYAG